ncbi:chemotaxis regulatory protein ChePep-like [Drosophila rhopaloa]|nr:chemotaxis regulatory protein ChePep-like [Drosophila rhopaloa]
MRLPTLSKKSIDLLIGKRANLRSQKTSNEKMEKYPLARELLGQDGQNDEKMAQIEEEIMIKNKLNAEGEVIRPKLEELMFDTTLIKQGGAIVEEITAQMEKMDTTTNSCLFDAMQIEHLLEEVGLQDILRYKVQQQEQNTQRQLAILEEQIVEEEKQKTILESRDIVHEYRLVKTSRNEAENKLTPFKQELDQLNRQAITSFKDLEELRNKKIIAVVQISKDIGKIQSNIKPSDNATIDKNQNHINQENIVAKKVTKTVGPTSLQQTQVKPSNGSGSLFQSSKDFLKNFLLSKPTKAGDESDDSNAGTNQKKKTPLRSIFVHRKKEASVFSTKSPSKKVRFAPDPELSQIFEFEVEKQDSGSDLKESEKPKEESVEKREESEEETEELDEKPEESEDEELVEELEEPQEEANTESEEETKTSDEDEEQPEDGSENEVEETESSVEEFNEEKPEDGSENDVEETESSVEEFNEEQPEDGSENQMEASQKEFDEEEPAEFEEQSDEGSENDIQNLEKSKAKLDEIELDVSDPELDGSVEKSGSESQDSGSDEEFDEEQPEDGSDNEVEETEAKLTKIELDPKMDGSNEKPGSESPDSGSDDETSGGQESGEEEKDKATTKMDKVAKPNLEGQKTINTGTKQKSSIKSENNLSFIPETPQIISVERISAPKYSTSKASDDLPSTSTGTRNRYTKHTIVVDEDKPVALDNQKFPMTQPLPMHFKHPSTIFESNDDQSLNFNSPNNDLNDDFLLNFSDDNASLTGNSYIL